LYRGVGCIFFEMASGRPLFPGSTVEDQLQLIFSLLGKILYLSWSRFNSCVVFRDLTLHLAHFSYTCISLAFHRDTDWGDVAGYSRQRRFLVLPLWPLRSAVPDPQSASAGRRRTRSFEQVPFCKTCPQKISFDPTHTQVLPSHLLPFRVCFSMKPKSGSQPRMQCATRTFDLWDRWCTKYRTVNLW